MTVIFAAYDAALGIVEAVTDAVNDGLPAAEQWTCIDGPVAESPSLRKMVLFGVNDPSSVDMFGVDAGVQDWAGLGDYAKLERFTLYGSVVVWHGDDDYTARRLEAQQFLVSLEAALLPDTATGVALAGELDSALTSTGIANFAVLAVKPVRGKFGFGLHIPFAITCATRQYQ